MPLLFTVDRNHRELTLSEQISFAIRDHIRRGELLPGEDMPLPSELARRLGVGFDTVRLVYRYLAKRGVIMFISGVGHFVPTHNVNVDINDQAKLGKQAEAAKDARKIKGRAKKLVKAQFEACLAVGLDPEELIAELREVAKQRPNGLTDRPLLDIPEEVVEAIRARSIAKASERSTRNHARRRLAKANAALQQSA